MLGGSSTTINPQNTAEELSYQLQDSKAAYLLMEEDAAKLRHISEHVPTIREVFYVNTKESKEKNVFPFSVLLEPSDVQLPPINIDPRKDTLVIPYSSGTTGLPKGVEITHYNMISNLCQVQSVGFC